MASSSEDDMCSIAEPLKDCEARVGGERRNRSDEKSEEGREEDTRIVKSRCAKI
jgi:hypothetical protein